MPEDLRGRRIGVSMGTTSEYFVDLLLAYYGIPKKEVRVVPLNQENMASALARDEIDAAVSWNPHAALQEKALGDNAVSLSNDSLYKIWWSIVAGQEYVKTHPGTVEKLLRAFVRAADYTKSEPEKAAALVERYVGPRTQPLADFDFEIQLGQALLLELEDQARWAIRTKQSKSDAVPNFLPLMYTRGIEAVAPGTVMLMQEGGQE